MNRVLIICLTLLSPLYFTQTLIKSNLQDNINNINKISFTNPDSALAILKEIEPSVDKKYKSKLLLIRANAYANKHLTSKALKCGFDALNTAQILNDSLLIAKSLGFIGNQFFILKLNKQAIDYLNKSETIFELLNNADRFILANNYFLKALIYKDELNSSYAIKYFDKAIIEYSKSNSRTNILNKNMARIQKGYALIDNGQISDAGKAFNDALNESKYYKLEEIMPHVKVGQAAYYSSINKFEKSNTILLEVKLKTKNLDNNGLILEIEEAMCENYFKLGNKKMYFYYSQKLERNLINIDNIEKVSFLDIMTSNINGVKLKLMSDCKKSFLYAFGVLIMIFLSIICINKWIKK